METNTPETAVVAAPEQALVASPESVESQSPQTQEAEGQVEGQPETPKVFTQEDVDRLIAKEKAKAERKVRRELTTQQPQMPVSTEPLTLEKFNGDPVAYADALATQKAQQLIQQREIERQNAQIAATFEDRVEEAREKYNDFDTVVGNPNLPITEPMLATIMASDIGPELAYHLGTNPTEAARIAQLPPLLQAKELGRLEDRLIANPPVKKVTSAPAPIAPVTARASSVPAYDTTDPRSDKMSTDDWIKAEEARIRQNAQRR